MKQNMLSYRKSEYHIKEFLVQKTFTILPHKVIPQSKRSFSFEYFKNIKTLKMRIFYLPISFFQQTSGSLEINSRSNKSIQQTKRTKTCFVRYKKVIRIPKAFKLVHIYILCEWRLAQIQAQRYGPMANGNDEFYLVTGLKRHNI